MRRRLVGQYPADWPTNSPGQDIPPRFPGVLDMRTEVPLNQAIAALAGTDVVRSDPGVFNVSAFDLLNKGGQVKDDGSFTQPPGT